MRALKTFLTVLSGYTVLTLVFIRGILFSPGMLVGGDWGFPYSIIEMNRYAQTGFYTWTDREFFGAPQFFLNTLVVQSFVGFLAKFNITGDLYTKAFLVGVFVLAGTAMYALCRFLKCSKLVSFTAGFVYITLPIFFNYAVMGWLFVLFSMGILPLALLTFIKSVQDDKFEYAIFTGILYSLAIVQSQTLIWYPLVFISFSIYLINEKKSFISFCKSFGVVLFTFLSLNAFWYLPLLFGGGSNFLNTNLASTGASKAIWDKLKISNMLRLWGSLWNESYEASTYSGLGLFTFVPAIAAFSALYIQKRVKLVVSLLFLSFVPTFFFLLGPQTIVKLPFSDVIRDIARFIVLSSFAYTVLIALLLNSLLIKKQKNMGKRLGILLIVLFVISSYPFWTGELYGVQRREYDIKLRTYELPQDYKELEEFLVKEPNDVKVLYLPIARELSIEGNKRLYGQFRGIRDFLASYSPRQGNSSTSERVVGITSDFRIATEDDINSSERFKQISNSMSLMNVGYVVVRKDMQLPKSIPGEKIINYLSSNPDFILVKEWRRVALFKYKKYLPHLHIPKSIVISKEGIDKLPQIIEKETYDKSAVYFSSQNKSLIPLGKVDKNYLNNPNQSLKFNKIDSTKFEVTINNITHAVPIVFLEAYHSQWHLYNKSNSLFAKPFSSDIAHFVVNGYANSWIIDPQTLCAVQDSSNICSRNPDGSYTLDFNIEFRPQRLFRVGMIITSIYLSVVSLYFVFKFVKFVNNKIYGKK